MKKLNVLLILLTLLPVGLSARTTYRAEKTIERTYPASDKHTLSIDSKFGNINVETWDKNEVSVIVTIVGESARSQKSADYFLDRVTINSRASGSTISFSTSLSDNRQNVKGGNSITYNVKVPRNISFVLSNKYGNITVDECGGKADVDVKYGNFYCPLLKGRTASLELGYGRAHIGKAQTLDAEVEYSTVIIGKVERLMLDSKYTTYEIEDAKVAIADSKYDKFDIEKAGRLKIETAYTDIQIGMVEEAVDVKNKYGGVQVKNVGTNAKRMNFDLSFTQLKVNINPKVTCSLNANITYGKLTIPEGGTRIQPNSKGAYAVSNLTIGNGTPTLIVKVTNRYANVEITK